MSLLDSKLAPKGPLQHSGQPRGGDGLGLAVLEDIELDSRLLR